MSEFAAQINYSAIGDYRLPGQILTILYTDLHRNITFYTGDITFPDDLAEAINNVSICDRTSMIN